MATNDLNRILAALGELALEEFVSAVRAESAKRDSGLGGFTLHETSHFSGVEQTLNELLHHQSESTQPPSQVERLVLRFCSWGHDVGMLRTVSEQYHASGHAKPNGQPWSVAWAREFHDEASAHFIVDKIQKIADRFTKDYSLNISEGSSQSDADHAKSTCEFNQRQLRDCLLTDGDKQLADDVIRYLSAKEHHNQISAHFTGLAHTVTLVASFHRRRKNPDLCPVSRDVLGVRVRARMLAAIFRLADALHIDRTRFSYAKFDALRYQPDFSPESRRHWMKSFLVSSISIDEDSHAVDVQLDLPESIPLDVSPCTLGTSRRPHESEKRRDIIAGMRNFIVNDLEEDVLSVSGILLEYSFPPLLRVRSRVHSVPAMVYTEEIWSVLDDLNAAASPNTSQLINAALGSIRETYTGDHASRTPLESAAHRLDSLKDMLDQRPCHEGLKKIRDLIEAIVNMFTDELLVAKAVHLVTGTQCITQNDLFKVCIEGAQSTFREQRDRCKSSLELGKFDQELEGFDNIVLYGYSDQVLDVMRRLVTLKRTPSLYILECRTKTQHTATSRLIYHDGSHYATAIREQVGPGPRIFLVPDSAIGRILEGIQGGRSRNRTLVLLGSNAITLDASLVHSMGHISVAAAAKCPRYCEHTSVFVLTDGLKIGGTREDVKLHEQHQRNKRYWLTTDASTQLSLDAADVVTMNWQEDLVPIELIDKILVLDRGETILAAAKDVRQRIEASRFNALEEFCEKLHKRIIAHNARMELDHQMTEHQDVLQNILKSQVNRSGVTDPDALCYVIAEQTLNQELPEVLEIQQPAAWASIRQAAMKGTSLEINNAVATFSRELSARYRSRGSKVQAAVAHA